jgi:hypothetical protein
MYPKNHSADFLTRCAIKDAKECVLQGESNHFRVIDICRVQLKVFGFGQNLDYKTIERLALEGMVEGMRN